MTTTQLIIILHDKLFISVIVNRVWRITTFDLDGSHNKIHMKSI